MLLPFHFQLNRLDYKVGAFMNWAGDGPKGENGMSTIQQRRRPTSRGPSAFPEGLHPSYPAVLVENCVKASFKYEDQNQHGMNLRRGASAEAPRMAKVNVIRQTCQPINPEDERARGGKVTVVSGDVGTQVKAELRPVCPTPVANFNLENALKSFDNVVSGTAPAGFYAPDKRESQFVPGVES